MIWSRGADHNQRDLFTLYRVTSRQPLCCLLAPSALPQVMAALKDAGGLQSDRRRAGRVFGRPAGQKTGLASRTTDSSLRIETPWMVAALVLVSIMGIVIFLLTSWASRQVIGHLQETEIRRENANVRGGFEALNLNKRFLALMLDPGRIARIDPSPGPARGAIIP